MALGMSVYRSGRTEVYEKAPAPETRLVLVMEKDQSDEIAYFGRATAIHHFFVEQAAGGVDDGEPIEVTRALLVDLHRRCRAVVAVGELAGAHYLPLPHGETTYGEQYFDQIKEAASQLGYFLSSPKYPTDGEEFFYQVSW